MRGLSGRTTEKVVVERARLGAGERDRGTRHLGARECADGRGECATPAAARDFFAALADEQQPGGLEARECGQQQRLGEAAREIAALQEATQGAVALPVYGGGRSRELATVVDTDHEAIDRDTGWAAGEDLELHGALRRGFRLTCYSIVSRRLPVEERSWRGSCPVICCARYWSPGWP